MDGKIGLGTAAIGRPLYINVNNNNHKKEFSYMDFVRDGRAVLDLAYQHGVRYFDTAPGYGMAEQLLVDWSSAKKEGTIQVATKWGYTYVADYSPQAVQHEIKEHSLAKLNEQWETSIKLLPHLSTYQIHSATLETGVLDNEKILNRLAELKDTHSLTLGISSTGANQVEVLTKASKLNVNGVELFDLFQVTYNVFDQSLQSIVMNDSLRGKRLVIKEALANGRVFPNDKYSHYEAVYNRLSELSVKYKVGMDAIALRFCIDSIPSYLVLSGASNEQHLISNLKANDIALEEDDINSLKELSIDPIHYWYERKKLDWN